MNCSDDHKDEFTFKAEQETYSLGTKEIKVKVINNSEKEQGYGQEFSIEKFENNKWTKVEFANDEFNELYCLIPSKYTGYITYDLTRIKDFDKLKSGKYRIVHCIGEANRMAEFELK